MSILFHQKSKKTIKVVFGFLAILIAISMVFLYAPGFFL